MSDVIFSIPREHRHPLLLETLGSALTVERLRIVPGIAFSFEGFEGGVDPSWFTLRRCHDFSRKMIFYYSKHGLEYGESEGIVLTIRSADCDLLTIIGGAVDHYMPSLSWRLTVDRTCLHYPYKMSLCFDLSEDGIL